MTEWRHHEVIVVKLLRAIKQVRGLATVGQIMAIPNYSVLSQYITGWPTNTWPHTYLQVGYCELNRMTAYWLLAFCLHACCIHSKYYISLHTASTTLVHSSTANIWRTTYKRLQLARSQRWILMMDRSWTQNNLPDYRLTLASKSPNSVENMNYGV